MHLHIDSLFRKRQTPSTVHAVTSENPQPDDPPAPTWAGMGVAYDEKRLPPTFWMIIAALTLGLIVSVAFQSAESGTFLLLMVLALPAGLAARSLGQPADKNWLPNLLMAGWAAKMFASGGRYWALQVLYNGVGDATGYHGRGVQYSPIWRSLQLPPLGTGTDFIDAAAGFLYIPYIPTKLGGFFIFATLAFVGQILYYTAFRRSVKTVGLKWYALLVFFFPNIIYWPSSIGNGWPSWRSVSPEQDSSAPTSPCSSSCRWQAQCSSAGGPLWRRRGCAASSRWWGSPWCSWRP